MEDGSNVTSFDAFNVQYVMSELGIEETAEPVRDAVKFMWDYFLDDDAPWDRKQAVERREAVETLIYNTLPFTTLVNTHASAFPDVSEEDKNLVMAAAICDSYIVEAATTGRDGPVWAFLAEQIWEAAFSIEKGEVGNPSETDEPAHFLYLVQKHVELEGILLDIQANELEGDTDKLRTYLAEKYTPPREAFMQKDCALVREVKGFQERLDAMIPTAQVLEIGK